MFHTTSVITGSVSVLVLFVLAWRLPKERVAFWTGAHVFAALCGAGALLHVVAQHRVAHYVSAAHRDMKDFLLAEAVKDTMPCILALAGLAAVTLVGGILVSRGGRERIVSAAIAVSLLAPTAWFGTRGRAYHEECVREAFAEVGPTDDGCLALSNAVDKAGGIERAAKYEPKSRALAHQCIGIWLSMLDGTPEQRATLEQRATVYGMLHPGKPAKTPADVIADSGLVVDDLDEMNVRLHQAVARSNAE